MTAPCVKGDRVTVTRPSGPAITGVVTAASDSIILVRQGSGFSAHIHYDGGLGKWTLAGRSVTITKEVR